MTENKGERKGKAIALPKEREGKERQSRRLERPLVLIVVACAKGRGRIKGRGPVENEKGKKTEKLRRTNRRKRAFLF